MSDMTPVFLVGVDGSEGAEHAARYAAKMALLAHGRLVLAHVIDWSDYSFINVLEIDERHEMRSREQKHAEEDIMQPLIAKLSAERLSVEARIEFGHPAKTLAKMAKQVNAEMIVAGTRGRSDIASLVLGSFSHNLLQLAERPVLFVP